MWIQRGKRYINKREGIGDVDRWRGEKGRGICRDSNRYRRGRVIRIEGERCKFIEVPGWKEGSRNMEWKREG